MLTTGVSHVVKLVAWSELMPLLQPEIRQMETFSDKINASALGVFNKTFLTVLYMVGYKQWTYV